MGTTLNFDASQVKPSEPQEVIPSGWYPMVITESEMKPTQDNQGGYLALTHEIIDGPFKGRKAFNNLNLHNKNQQAVEIAYRDLSAICHATGVIQVGDSAMLHGKTMMVKLKVEPAGLGKDGKQYEARNAISGYKPMEGGTPQVQAQAPTAPWTPPAATPPVTQPAPQGNPWDKKETPEAPTAPWTPPAAPQQPSGAATPPWANK